MEFNKEEKLLIDSPFLEDLADKYDYFLCDCDGVLWETSEVIPKSLEALKYLKSRNKSVFFISNGSMKSQAMYANKIKAKFGIEVEEKDIYGSAYVTAQYVKMYQPQIKNAYVIGHAGIVNELKKIGVKHVGSDDHQFNIISKEEFPNFNVDPKIDAVIIGLDFYFNFYKLCYASACVQKGCKFLSTNKDVFDTIKEVYLPGGGGLVEAVEQVTSKKALVLGKPNPIILDIIMNERRLDSSSKNKFVMIGDRLDTDICFGKNAGIDTILVLTGASQISDVEKERKKPDPIIPTYILPTFGHFRTQTKNEY